MQVRNLGDEDRSNRHCLSPGAKRRTCAVVLQNKLSGFFDTNVSHADRARTVENDPSLPSTVPPDHDRDACSIADRLKSDRIAGIGATRAFFLLGPHQDGAAPELNKVGRLQRQGPRQSRGPRSWLAGTSSTAC
jgi:hypothetical protein